METVDRAQDITDSQKCVSSSADSPLLRSSKQDIGVKNECDLVMTFEPAEKMAKYNQP